MSGFDTTQARKIAHHNRGWPVGESLAEACDEIDRLHAALTEAETKLRRELWTNHGHDYYALYGDGGEMYCSACPFDFKRASVDDCFKQRMIVAAAVSGSKPA